MASPEHQREAYGAAPAWTESLDQTVIAGTITDAKGNVYTVSGGQILVRLVGTSVWTAVPPHSTGISQIAYAYAPTHAVWGQNAALKTWWRLSAPLGPWIGPQTASPLGPAAVKQSITINAIGPQVAGKTLGGALQERP